MAKTVSWVLGVVLVIAGVWGFFGGDTSVGFLASSVLSSIIHVVIGVIVLAMAGKPSAGMTLRVVGIIYVILGLLGFFDWSFIPVSSATNWFYLIVGVVVAVLGFTSKGASAAAPASAPQM